MKEIIQWLQNLEQLACDTNNKAAHYFESDIAFSTFLKQIADDES